MVRYFCRTLLSRTLSGNRCDLLTISNNYYPGVSIEHLSLL